MSLSLLVAEDDLLQREMIGRVLTKRLGYSIETVTNGHAALERVLASNIDAFDAVLLDIQMPKMDGFETLKAIKKHRPDLPVLMLTASDDTEIAVRAIKEGASDFIVKPPEPARLDVAIKNAIRLSTLARELTKMKRDKEGALHFGDLVGHRNGLSEAVMYGRKAAVSNVPVLITGESGVGKELFARAIHGESKRVGAPFIAINCSALPEHMAERALFAPDKGAFRRAEGGTLFLDDIGKLPQEAQVRLLRALQYHDIEPMDGGKPIKINVRLIAANEHDLARDVQAGLFRDDLYFRLNILPIALTPLRERPEDIVPIAEYFLQRLAASEGLLTKSLSKEAKIYLTQQHWLGNVRELENLIHRAMVLADDSEITHAMLQQIHEVSGGPKPTEHRTAPVLHINLRDAEGFIKPIERIELETMRAVLVYYEDNITKAADALGMAKSTFYRKIKDANIRLPVKVVGQNSNFCPDDTH